MPFVVTLGAAVGGALLASALRVPMGTLIGATVGVGLLKVLDAPTYQLPEVARFVVYVGVGWLLGQTFTAQALGELRRSVVPILAIVVAFIVFGLVQAFVLYRYIGFDAYTAFLATSPGGIAQMFLATSPGGIAQMGVLSIESKANVPLVLTVHVLRIVSVIVVASVGLRILGDRL